MSNNQSFNQKIFTIPEDKRNTNILITSTDIEEILDSFIRVQTPDDEEEKKSKLSLWSYVYYKHPKKTNNEKIKTTIGRIIFNLCLPEDYPFINEEINRKKINNILKEIYDKYGPEEYSKTLHKLQTYILDIGTIASPTFELTEFELPEHIEKMKEELQSQMETMSPVEIDKKLYEIYEELQKYLESKGLSFFDMVKSGTKGKADDLIQLFIAWGYGVDGEGNLTPPVKHSLFEGMKPEEMYYGANKAITAAYFKSVGSAKPGHVAIILRNALNDVYVDWDTEDCRTDKYFELKVTKEIAGTILGRYYYDENKKELVKITEGNINQLIGKIIKLRSPLYCKSERGICLTCYGDLAKEANIKHAGLNATGSYYVKGLNLLMKISHHRMTAGEEVDFEKEFERYF